MSDPTNPMTEDLDFGGHRGVNAVPSNLDTDYVTRGELEGLVLATLTNASFLLRSGLNPMQGDLNLDGHYLLGQPAATLATHLMRKGEVDAADAALSAALTTAYQAADTGLQTQINGFVMGIRGEIFMTRAGYTATGLVGTFDNPSTGVFTWTVPDGVNKLIVDIIGGGGAGGYSGNTARRDGSATSILDSTASTTLAQADGGQGGNDFTNGAGAASSSSGLIGGGQTGGGPAGEAPYCGDTKATGGGKSPIFGRGGLPNAGGGTYGGGAAGGDLIIPVTPGNVLTFTIGAGGVFTSGIGGTPGGDGMCRVRW